ncbi:MAG TPA: LCP family protein [Verrucomicrobiae bacterium]|nr:LCP family protein [Verrucomicrobiae bacterium]
MGSPGFAAVLSGLLPGLGQIYEDRWVKGILMIILPVLAITLGGAFVAYADPLTAFVLQHAPLVTFVLIGSALVFHLSVVADAFAGRLGKLRGRMAVEYAVLALVTLALIAGYGTIYRQSAPWASVAARMFAPFATKAVAPPTAPEQEAPSWSGNDRLNILVMGVDTREADPATRNTDTMLVLSLDPVNKTAAMLSIPRDVYIDKPGTFQGKINSAYASGGPNLARRLVDDLLGIRIHTYVLVNFEAFNKIVDGVGGVVVDAKRPVRDEYYPTPDYGIERVNILTGPQLMHGDLALKYARSRHDTNDYSRARRQQEVIGALRTRLTQADALRTLPSLIDTVGTTLETDFDPANVLPLARTGTGIASADISSDVLYPCGGDYPHCELMYNGDNGFFLLPDRAKVRDFAAQLFYDPRIRQEGAHVEIENSGARAGAAKDVADRLALRAYGIVGVTNGSTARSVILVRNTSKRYTAEQLRQALGGIPMETSGDGSGGPDIVVRIGSDFKGFATDASIPTTK